MTNKNENVSINFLFTGHTKFSPDRNFGIIKFKFAKQNVDCHNDLIQLMNESSQNGFNVAIQSKDPITKIRDIKWASWDSFMKQYSKPIPGITKYHHFTTCKSGEIKAQLIVDSPIKIIHNQMELGSGKRIVPLQLIEPEGLTLKRCWYLYEEIRNYCFNEANKDLVGPKPSIAINMKKIFVVNLSCKILQIIQSFFYRFLI